MSSSGLTTILASSSSTPTDHRSSSNHHHRLLLASNPASAGSLAHTQSSSFLSNNSSNNTSNHNIISSLVPSVNVTCRSSLLNSHTAGAASFLSSADSNNSITTASTILNDSEFPSLGVRSSPSSTSAFTSIPTTSYSSQSPISSSNSSGSGAGGGNGGGQHTSIGLGVGANNILNNINGLTSNSGTSNSITTSLSATTTQPNITNNIINNNLYSSTSNNSNNSSTGASSVAKDVYTALQRPYANLMRTNDGNSLSANNVEFHIQNEDFPALPGANHLDATHGQIPLGNNTDGVLSDSRYTERSTTTISENTKTGIQTFPDGTVKNIPAGMLSDQFGMAGLLTFLRAIESDPAIVALALGHDLTTLGLNLNAPERNLYATFGGPWADFPCRTQDLDAKVPEEYLTNVAIREKLPNIKLNKLSEDVLFYLFYNCPGEVYQMAAACELYSRDWRFHKGLCVWLTRSQYGGVKEQTSTYEKGSYNVFDPVQWRKIPKDMTLEYKELEERPKLPQSLQQQQQQTSGQQAAQTGATNVVSQNGS